jgi:membrane protease subunit (stomatin/prohibitin family)
MAKISFTSNYDDLSTDTGFQFEFKCDRCGKGYRTGFQASAVGTVATAVEAASNLFGGIFGSAANMTNTVKSAGWQQARDKAFEKAADEVRSDFKQCPRCQQWVCVADCWNENKGLCKSCAPDLGVEMAAAQASKSVEEVWAHAAMAEEDKKLGTENWREGKRANCPACGKTIANVDAKFCADCGAPINPEKHCSQCGEKMKADAKFCAGCGAKA